MLKGKDFRKAIITAKNKKTIFPRLRCLQKPEVS